MTELDLYKWIHDNSIEYHVYRHGIEKLDLREMNEDNYHEWKIYVYPFFFQLESLMEIVKPSFFDDERFECVMKHGYICFDIMDIAYHYGIDVINIFNE